VLYIYLFDSKIKQGPVELVSGQQDHRAE